MIIAGVATKLTGVVYTAADNSMFTGTAKCVVYLESDDADDGKYWNHAGAAWAASDATAGDATALGNAQYTYDLPAAATSGKAGDVIHFTYTDNLTEASATTVASTGTRRIWAEDPFASTDTHVDEEPA